MLAMSKEKWCFVRAEWIITAKNSWNVPVLEAIRKKRYVARLTYCIAIQSGRACEYPKAEKHIYDHLKATVQWYNWISDMTE